MAKERFALLFKLFATLWQVSPVRTMLVIISLVAKNIFSILQLWSLIELIDMLTSVMDGSMYITDLYNQVFLLLAIVLAHQLLQLIATYLEKTLQGTAASLIQTRLIKAVAFVPLHLKETPKYRRLLANAEQAIELNDALFFTNFVQLINLVLELISFLVLLVFINWLMVVPVVLLVTAYLVVELKALDAQGLVEGIGWEEQRKADYIFDLATSKRASLEVHFFGLGQYLSDSWSSLVNKAASKLTRATITKGVYEGKGWQDYLVSITWFLVLLSSFALLCINVISLGAFIIILDLVRRLDNAVTRGRGYLSHIAIYLRDYFTSLWSLLEAGNFAGNIFGDGLFLPSKDDEILTTPLNKIEFKDVYFTYPDYTIGIRQVSVSINKGEIVALVGPNGAGKSTFIKLLLGIYFPEKGRILIDGHPLHKDNVYNWWGRVSVVFQDYARFSLTIRENIGFNHIREEEIWAALDKVGLSELVHSFPAGLDTVLGDATDGYEPSGGQWQRFALARAFAKDGDLVIFDEPSASLDVFAEEQVFQEFRRFGQGKTGIFVSHRLGPARLADKIIVFQSGRIVEIGNHHQLIKAGGLYAQMYAIQADHLKH